MANYVSLILLFTLGYVLRRVPAFPRESANTLNLFVIYVSLPALILYQVPGMNVSGQILLPVAMPWAMLCISALAVLWLASAFKWDAKVKGALLMVVPLGNTSFLGIPMVTGFFGADKVPYALLYDQFGTFLALSLYGTFVLAYYGGSSKPTARQIAQKILTFPPFIALAIALLTSGMQYPEYLRQSLKMISASLVPVVMVAIGFQFKVIIDREHSLALAAGLGIKLLAAPLAALLICLAFGMEGTIAKVTVFEAAMPPMVTAGALAIMSGLAPELSAAMVGWGILASFVTLPAMHRLLEAAL